MSATVAAVDLGASSGRVMLGRVGAEELELHEAHRFANEPVTLCGTLHWDVVGLYRGILAGLAEIAGQTGALSSIGVDSWGVDYALLDAGGSLLGLPVHHRDGRTDGVPERVLETVPAGRLYATSGLQVLPINTIFQLAAELPERLAAADQLLMIPDLLSYWLTGMAGSEITNASTTGLLDIHTREWSADLLKLLGFDRSLFAELRAPGEPAGELSPDLAARAGFTGRVPVTAVASHDTASAVLAVPAATPRFGYISCGTWSLVGVETSAPVLSEASRGANFANEGGVDGTFRYLRNVMGLWLLQESVRCWEEAGMSVDLPALLDAAARLPGGALLDLADPAFLPPGDMPARIRAQCARTGQPEPGEPAEYVRCVLDSLAVAYRDTLRAAADLSGVDIDVVHIVGGGSRNDLLCQLTADACGLPVVAGPVEATALGNALIQGRAIGAVHGGLPELRGLVAQTQRLRHFQPSRLP
jgi:rhamnulokinase